VASIRAQLETALQYPDDVDWPAVARIVLAEDTRLEHLVGNLLAMARLEEGRLGPRSEIDMDDLVLAQTQRMTGVRLDLSGVSGGRVWGNLDELTSVVRNLLDNAARYAESTVSVGVRENGPWVVVTVADDGPGVPPADRERVFERFARLQEGRERDRGGTGLGLALSQRVAQAHGGRIHVEDAPSGGACFVVSLPSAGWTGTPDLDPERRAEGPAGAPVAEGQLVPPATPPSAQIPAGTS
jgi:signal transduction histidine kinase